MKINLIDDDGIQRDGSRMPPHLICNQCGATVTTCVAYSGEENYEGYVCPNRCDLDEVGATQVGVNGLPRMLP